MREATVSRFVRAPIVSVERALTPERIVEYEETFSVLDVTESAEGARVVAGARGLEIVLQFEDRGDGWHYRQEGDAGPFDEMETTVTWRRENEGVRVTMQSAVSLGLFPRSLTDHVAAWKREAELERALSNLATAVE